jgi:hypothetical protein
MRVIAWIDEWMSVRRSQEMNMEREINLLSDDKLDVVAGGLKNDPPTTKTIRIEYAGEIANTKALGPISEYPI